MWRTVLIDDELLVELRRVLGTRGIQDTLEAGLREAVRRYHLGELRRSLGNIEPALTSMELESLRDQA